MKLSLLSSFARRSGALGAASAIVILAAAACGSSGPDDDPAPPPASPAAPGDGEVAARPASTAPSAATGQGGPVTPASERQGAAAAVDDPLGSACAAELDACSEIEGCDRIVACAAQSACAGRECYCADDACGSPGPCRAVIDAAPGAASGPGTGGSRGPAADAAAAVGACVLQLAGGLPGAGD